jgi:aryl-alcohol dehydrogenase-like predicted oxidoreductase
MMLSAFPGLVARKHGAHTVLTGRLDRSALYGVLAEVEALGLELLEVRQLPASGPQAYAQPRSTGGLYAIASPGPSTRPEGDMMSAYALGKVQVRRSGYGAMQLAGPFAFGTPPDRASAVRVLQAAVSAGVNHIDTADYYGPGMVNDLIREALYPYPDGLAIVSKVAVSGAGRASDHQDQLRAGIEDNLRRLRVGQLAAVNLRMPGDGRVDARFDDQLAAMAAARDDGLIAGIGLSNVSLGQLKHALAGTEIACVQNLFHLADRSGAPVLQECLRRGIAFVPFCPLGWPRGRDNPVLTSPVVARTAARLGATPAQVALQWLLQLAPNVLLIPGTGSVTHLRDNLSAEDVRLDDEALRQLNGVAQVQASLLPARPGRPGRASRRRPPGARLRARLAVRAWRRTGSWSRGCGRAASAPRWRAPRPGWAAGRARKRPVRPCAGRGHRAARRPRGRAR